VPILSTEGGPVVGWKEDRRYPRIDPLTHAEWVVAINDFMQGGRQIHGLDCPNNYFTMCHWLLGNYWLGFMAPGWESQSWYTDWWNQDFNLSGQMPVVRAVKAMRNIPVDGQNLAVVSGGVLRADDDEPLADLVVKLWQKTAKCLNGHRSDARFALSGWFPASTTSWWSLGCCAAGMTAALEPCSS